jgi:1,4-alpha-glucan branching enzyme
VWLCPENDWIYRHLHEASARMVELANHYHACGDTYHRALNQAARELMLAQASDWAFIMHTGTTVSYATRRTTKHLTNFFNLYEMIKTSAIDESKLTHLEECNNIFPLLDYRIFRTRHKHNSMAT